MDILSLILQAIADRAGAPETFTESVAREFEAQFRQHYGGDYYYLAAKNDRTGQVRRNQEIIRDARRGERVELLVRRYQLSRKQIRRILADASEDGCAGTSSP